jgi:quinol monooxygenase YgiN
MRVALCVTFKPAAGKRKALIERLETLSRTCLQTEPGCLRFDVLVPLDEADDRILLYELYESEEALRHHDQTPHFLEYRRDTADMVAERVRVACAVAES